MKVCNHCKVEKADSEFGPKQGGRYSLGHCRECNGAYHRRYRQERPHIRGERRRVHLWKKYGLTADEYDRLHAGQEGGCAICGVESETDKPLSVDHDHGTDKVRALLCRSCNLGLGHFKDSRVLLRNAADYLDSHVHWHD